MTQLTQPLRHRISKMKVVVDKQNRCGIGHAAAARLWGERSNQTGHGRQRKRDRIRKPTCRRVIRPEPTWNPINSIDSLTLWRSLRISLRDDPTLGANTLQPPNL